VKVLQQHSGIVELGDKRSARPHVHVKDPATNAVCEWRGPRPWFNVSMVRSAAAQKTLAGKIGVSENSSASGKYLPQ